MQTTKPQSRHADIREMTFERALKELEAIVGRLERGDVELEESISIYERGEALKEHCDRLLKQAEAKVEKLKEGKEKLKVNGKEYDTTWTTYKVAANAQGMNVNAEVKAWIAKDIPLSLAKMEMSAEFAGQKMKMTMEVTETGNKK